MMSVVNTQRVGRVSIARATIGLHLIQGWEVQNDLDCKFQDGLELSIHPRTPISILAEICFLNARKPIRWRITELNSFISVKYRG